MLDVLQGASLVAAALTTGLMAGVFWLYSTAIMPGLGQSDNRTFVGAFQWIDRAIINPVFLSTFLGALVLNVVAAALHIGEDASVFPWVAAALVLYLVVVVITVRVHVPLNDEIKGAGDPDEIADLAAVRDRFEARWVRWNLPRVLLSTAALGCLAWALAEYGKTL